MSDFDQYKVRVAVFVLQRNHTYTTTPLSGES